MSWIKILQLELSGVTKFVEPRKSVDEETEIRLGEANDEVKRLFTLREKMSKAAAEISVQARFAETDSAREEAADKLHELKQKIETIERNMWTSINEQFGHWEKAMGIRQGFVVVIIKPQPPTLEDFLDSL